MTTKAYLDHILQTYAVVAVLSEKNGGKVLRLRHKELKKDLILRQYPERIAAYSLLSGIRCENLPEIYDVTDCEDGQIVLEEFIDGATVAQIMECGRYHARGAKNVLRGVCRALSVLHSRGIVHRDVKPENVMVTATGRVVLIDLNAARQVKNVSCDTVILGTVGYASPEQLGVSQSDARTDIYAAGVLLNVMLTGKHPSVYLARGRMGQIVEKCTAIHPDHRYPTAEKLAQVL